jgi:hypothetical protein
MLCPTTYRRFVPWHKVAAIGIGGASRLLPSHTTVRTGPYTAPVVGSKSQEVSDGNTSTSIVHGRL